jgi:hypothetical protein
MNILAKVADAAIEELEKDHIGFSHQQMVRLRFMQMTETEFRDPDIAQNVLGTIMVGCILAQKLNGFASINVIQSLGEYYARKYGLSPDRVYVCALTLLRALNMASLLDAAQGHLDIHIDDAEIKKYYEDILPMLPTRTAATVERLNTLPPRAPTPNALLAIWKSDSTAEPNIGQG